MYSYYRSLSHKLYDIINEKWRGILSRGEASAPVYTAAVAKAAGRECDFIQLNYPPYSPDLAPSDYFLFGKMKSDLKP
jgi:hypothetical protein